MSGVEEQSNYSLYLPDEPVARRSLSSIQEIMFNAFMVEKRKEETVVGVSGSIQIVDNPYPNVSVQIVRHIKVGGSSGVTFSNMTLDEKQVSKIIAILDGREVEAEPIADYLEIRRDDDTIVISFLREQVVLNQGQAALVREKLN